MRSLSPVGRTVFGLLLQWTTWTGVDVVRCASAAGLRCAAPGRTGSLHPVQGLLERFQAGPGCAALEPGEKETHVVALGRVSNSPENEVTVSLKPLAPPPARLRVVHLLLSSKLPVTWWLQAEDLPPRLLLQVEVSLNSSVRSAGLRVNVHTLPSLPVRPRALHRWAVRNRGGLSSMTHSTHGNHVYIRLGQDPTQPAVCQLQSMFVSHNYIISDVQHQEVQGCARLTAPDRSGPEVHVLKLHSAGSGLCGSLQVEVVVSLLPPPGGTKARRVVLVLSSSVPVNWAVVARGVRGHVTVHSSNSVSPPHPAEPGLTLTSTLTSDLATVPDLLLWARESGYSDVSSYTEADLANRFVIQLSEDGGEEGAWSPAAPAPPRVEERRLRQWLSGGGGERAGRESLTVNCEDGRLGVAVDQHVLQSLPVPVSAVTLSDSSCQAQSNGTHFLLVFPVISCGTEGLLLRQPRGVQYKNTVLLWKENRHNQTKKSDTPLSIHFSCFVPIPAPAARRAEAEDPGNTSQIGLVSWKPEDPRLNPGLTDLPKPRLRPGPVLLLKLFSSESYEETRVGPCVVTAERRVHVQISARAPVTRSVQVKSCIVSPSSDPKKSPYWAVIGGGCSSDPSLSLSEEGQEAEGEPEEETQHISRSAERSAGAEEEVSPLRFSFVLRPVYNEPMQFLHCSLQLCASAPVQGKVKQETVTSDCRDRLRIPPLVSGSHWDQCEIRNLSRPMVVTQSISSLASRVQTPPGQRTKRLSVNPADSPGPEHGSSVVGTGPLMGLVFTAFVLGVGLMGGLWCIYNYTGRQSMSFQENHLTDQTHLRHIWSPSALSAQPTSSE